MQTHLPRLALAFLLLVSAARAQSPPETATGRSAATKAWTEGQSLLASRNSTDVLAAVGHFERAVTADATFAPAFAGLAEAKALLYNYAEAKAAAVRALALDDRLAEAHAVLGFARLHGEWDWAGAEAELRRALELEPGRPVTRLWLGIVLEVTGRSDEAVTEARRAVELAPGQANVRAGLGFRLFWARRYDEAIKELEAALELDSDYAAARYFIGRALVEQGRFDEARTVFARARALSPKDSNLVSAEAYLDARSGNREAAFRALAKLVRLASSDRPYASQVAGLYAALGDSEAVFEWLVRARENREAALVWLKIDPRFDAVRDAPRFREMLQRMGL